MKILVVVCFISAVSCMLEERLKHFDAFHHEDLKHRINKRDIYTKSPENRDVEFSSLGRKFKLNLKKYKSLFTDDFKVIVANDDGERVLDILPNLYHGSLEDDEDSTVQAYFDSNGIFTGTVTTSDKKYVFEPSWRHLPDKNVTMIAYDESHVNYKYDLGESFCGVMRVPDQPSRNDAAPKNRGEEEANTHPDRDDFHGNHNSAQDDYDDDDDDGKHPRSKRSTSSCTKDNRMICTLMLVADYKFFVNMGNRDFEVTTSYLISIIDQVNQIYRKQEFGACGSGFEFEIREIRIHDSYSDGSNPIYGYNMDRFMNTSYLLELFSRNARSKDFCLSHLFTYTPFEGGILGLAYIGSPRMGSLGGVCSADYGKDGFSLYINTGWSSSVNKYNRKLLTAEAYIVTAHELGHNWGSEHDPDIDECSPSHGKYIMYMYSVSGREENNKKFSPCSRRSMGSLIKGKAQSCFKQKSGAFCGNFKVEEGEECDEGPHSTMSVCCTNCKLNPRSQCSDINHECCEKCSFAPSSKSCVGEQDSGCKLASMCSGVNTSCIPSSNKPNGADCMGNGKCVNGKCLTICEYHGKLPCICESLENACKWCCKDTDGTGCQPFQNSTSLPPGTPCVHGLCDEKGKCQKQAAQNSILRLWSIIENIDANSLVMFMRANIVGTVIIFSLLIWIPASCVVSCVDKKKAAKQRKEYMWYSAENDELLPPGEDQYIIKKSSEVKFPQRT